MACRRAALLAHRFSPSATTYAPLQSISSKLLRPEPTNSRQSSSQTTKPSPPNVSDLYKTLTRGGPTRPPDPALTALLSAAQESNDPKAAVKALTANLTSLPIHRNHITTAVSLCLPTNLSLAESLLSNLSRNLPPGVLVPARATLAKHYTSRNDPNAALAALNFPARLLSASDTKLRESIQHFHLGTSPFVWGTLIKSLTLANKPAHACAVVDAALVNRVSVTDAFLHLCIDAFRLNGQWKQACSLFDSAIRRGLTPSERTVASLLYALTSRTARQHVEKTRIVDAVDMVQSPSMKFLNVALMGLTSIGALERAERVLVEIKSGGLMEDHIEKMLAGLGNYLELLPAEEVDNVDTAMLTKISSRANELWDEYLRLFPVGRCASSVLAKVIRVKSRCFNVEQAVHVLEKLVEDGRGDILDISHIGGVMGAVELLCDVEQVQRLLVVMEKVGMNHDMRSIAFWLGTLLGDGNMADAVDVVRTEVIPLVMNGDDGVKGHYPTVLLRRLRSLRQALQDGGVGRVAEVDEALRVVERMQGDFRGREIR